MELLLALAMGYLFGSIPFGLLLAMAAGKGDIRKMGSGNIGATNVLRTGSKWLAAATLLLDLAKGLVPVVLAGEIWWILDGHEHRHALATMLNPMAAEGWEHWLFASPEAVAAIGAVLGHCFPIWLKFKGGKGVATNLGVSLGLGGLIGLTYAAVWLAMAAAFRISSLAGMSAVVAAAIAAWVFGYAAYGPVLTIIAILILWFHRANIGRLMRGEEPKIGKKS